MSNEKKRLGACKKCVYFNEERGTQHSGACMLNPPVLLQHLIQLNQHGAVDTESVFEASVYPMVEEYGNCSHFLSADDVEYVE